MFGIKLPKPKKKKTTVFVSPLPPERTVGGKREYALTINSNGMTVPIEHSTDRKGLIKAAKYIAKKSGYKYMKIPKKR